MKKFSSTALAGAIGATFIASLTVMPTANAAENPFAAKPLVNGYQLADAKDGTCGGKKAEKSEAHCGSKSDKDGHCGGKAKSKKDGSCGESKCGANKKK